MCSRTDSWLRVGIVASLVLVAVSLHATTLRQPEGPSGQGRGVTIPQQSSAPTEQRFEQATIERALEVVKADPKIAPERTIKTLRWKGTTERRRAGPPSWLA